MTIRLSRNISLVNLYQDCLSHHDSSKNMAVRGRGSFPLYIYIENCKNLLVRNHWTDSNINGRNVPLVTLYQDCSSRYDSAKSMAASGAGLIFPIYIYIGIFKTLLVRNNSTDVNIIWQECFFGYPLPRLFKPA